MKCTTIKNAVISQAPPRQSENSSPKATYLNQKSNRMYMHVCIHVRTHACMHTCTYTCMSAYMYVYMHVCIHALHACMQTCTYKSNYPNQRSESECRGGMDITAWGSAF